MQVGEAIRRAVEATIPAEQRATVLEGLASIPEETEAEALQAAVLVLAFGDMTIFHGQLMNARIEPRDVLYVLESPELVQPGLTTDELRRRYQKLGLPVHRLLGGG